MARQEEIYVTGAIEHLIFYKYRGKYCCRHRPYKVNQTAATRTSGQQFGKASRLSRILRTSLVSLLPAAKDKKMIYRLNNAFYQWLRSQPGSSAPAMELPHLQAFAFTTQTLLSAICPTPIIINWEVADQVSVTIPEIQWIKGKTAPYGTEILYWQLSVCSCPLEGSITASKPHHITLEIPYGEAPVPAQEVVLPFTIQPGAIAVVAAALRYEYPKLLADQDTGNQQWQPAGIVGTCYLPAEGVEG